MIDTSAVIEHRLENRYDTLEEIGNTFQISTSYVHDILTKHNVYTKALRKNKASYCKNCSSLIEKGDTKFHQGKCRFDYFRIIIPCTNCTIPFFIRRGRLVEKKRRGQTKIYCSRHCYERARTVNSK